MICHAKQSIRESITGPSVIAISLIRSASKPTGLALSPLAFGDQQIIIYQLYDGVESYRDDKIITDCDSNFHRHYQVGESI